MNTPPPYFSTSIFNSNAFRTSNYLTREEADALYLSISFLNILSGTPGIVSANKALIADSNRDLINFHNIESTDSDSHILFSGINSHLTLSGSGSHIIINNTEGGNSTGSQGAIKNQGGAYFGNTLYINSTTNDVITINNSSSTGRSNIKFINNSNLALEIGVRGSTASNPSTYYTYFNGNYQMLMNIAGDVQYLSTTDASSYTNASMTLMGGLGVAKKVYINGNTEINSTFRVTGINTPSSGAGLEINYSASISNIYSYDRGAGSYKKINFNDLVTYDKANNIVTSRATYDLGNTIYLNDSIASGLINVNNTNKRMYIQSPQNTDYSVLTFNRYGLYLNSSTSAPFSECNANCLLDFGSQAKACSINLYGGTYSLSANNNATQICSGGSNGITMNTGGVYDVGAQLAKFTPQGSLMVTSTVRAQGENATGFSGAGVEMIYTGGIGYIYAYDRSSLLYRNMIFNDTIYTSGLFKTTGIGTLQTSYVLTVGYNTQTIATGYGYINSGGSVGTGGSTGAVSFSAQFLGRINVTGEVDIASDRKCKTEINDLEEYEAISFIENIVPKKYIFKPDTHNDHQYGYIAQDVAKLGIKYPDSYLKHLVTCIKDENQPEFIDEDNFVSPKDCMLNLNYIKCIPLLHKYILKQKKQIDEQQKQIDFLLQENKENNERINELVDSINEIYDILHKKHKEH